MIKRFQLFLLICLLLAACKQNAFPVTLTPTRRFAKTSIPTFTPRLTFTPTLTSTPQPPLIAHEWYPEQVLILKDSGKWPALFGPLFPPDFILYADGSLFVRIYDQNDPVKIRLLFRKLNRSEICKHLNTFDQIGYLDFQPSTYDPHLEGYVVFDGGSEIINVNAWKATQGGYSTLAVYLENQAHNDPYGLHPSPFIAPALRDVYYFLTDYPTDKFQIYQPDLLGVWTIKYEKESLLDYPVKFGPWPFTDISLKDLWAQAGSLDTIDWKRYVVLDGDQARNVYDFLGQSFYDSGALVYEEDADGAKTQYLMFARPILPFENPAISPIPAPGSPKPNFNLTCYPSDGVLPIPAPPTYE